MSGPTLVVTDVEVGRRRGVGVRVVGGRIEAVGPDVRPRPGERTLDGAGGALVPGLHDHHVHVLALAARDRSVEVGPALAPGPDALGARLRDAAAHPGPDGWVRAVGYDDAVVGLLDRGRLDAWVPQVPVRVQDRTGASWVLNSAGLAVVLAGAGSLPPEVERDERGAPTGRIWRGDTWLRSRLPATPPDLASVGTSLAARGVTALTDATVGTGAAEVAVLAAALAAGELPQRLWVMSGGPLEVPSQPRLRLGPVKVVLDDARLPPLEEVAERVRLAHRAGRAVAVHCVTLAELVVALAAFGDAGTQDGDRIEHAGVVPVALVDTLRALRLTVVTQPAFVADRGDAYLRHVDPRDQPDLYRCRSLLDAGVPVAASTDAPFGPSDPWAAVRAARWRTTASGRLLGQDEAVGARRALALFQGSATRPGGRARRVVPGAPADLCLLRGRLAAVLDDVVAGGEPTVAATVVDGAVVALDDPGRLNLHG